MAGCLQKAAWLRQWQRDGRPDDWRRKFGPISDLSRKVMCLECGGTGYDGGLQPNGWQVSCLIGHKDSCGACGAPVNNLGAHLNCLLHHEGCCQHLDGQWRRMKARKGVCV